MGPNRRQLQEMMERLEPGRRGRQRGDGGQKLPLEEPQPFRGYGHPGQSPRPRPPLEEPQPFRGYGYPGQSPRSRPNFQPEEQSYELFQTDEGKFVWGNNPKTHGQEFNTVDEAVNAIRGTEAWKDEKFHELYGPDVSGRVQTPEDWKALRKLREELDRRLLGREEFILKRGGKVSKRKGGGKVSKRKGRGKVMYGYKKGGQV